MSTVETVHEIQGITKAEWLINGGYDRPDTDRIKLMLINLKKLLDEQEGDLAQVESGGILMRKDGEHTDVFIHLEELDLDE